MTKAKVADKVWVVNLLSLAFDENQSVNYIVCQDKNRKKRIKALIEYSFEICLMFGEVWLSNDRQACGMILYPENKKITFSTLWLDLKLVFQSIGLTELRKVLKRESKIKAKQPLVKMSYLWFIGVNPVKQQMGVGSELLLEIINYSKKNARIVFLETSTLKNLSWYKLFGFKIYDKLELTYTLYFLNNEASSQA